MYSDDLLRLLRRATGRCVAGSDVAAVAYSGGVDSAVIEALAREKTRTMCYTCAFPGSHDHTRTPISAAESGIDLRLLNLCHENLEDVARKTCAALDTEDPLRVAYSIPLITVVDRCDEDVVLVGSGADELFGGYAKYLEEEDPAGSMVKDLEKALAENASLAAYARSVGKRLEAPFMDSEVVSFAAGLPLDAKLGRGNRKVVLREAAKSLGVLSHDSPKKAAQYSSGVMREMRRMASERGTGLREWMAELAADGRRNP